MSPDDLERALQLMRDPIHTYDITQGLRAAWQPPADLSAAVLARLAPDVPAERRHPADVLLRYTGRLGDAGPWRWNAAHPAPGVDRRR